MLLQRVIYELFDHEAEAFASQLPAGRDELDRQVRLEGADGERTYISWAWGDGEPDYFLAHADKSFFTDDPYVELDVSSLPGWQSLIGHEVTLRYRDRSRQVIELRAGDRVVYCASFQCDRVFVMLDLPAQA